MISLLLLANSDPMRAPAAVAALLPDPLPTCDPAAAPKSAPARFDESNSCPLDKEDPNKAPKAVAALLPDPSPTLLPKTPPIIAPNNFLSVDPVVFFCAAVSYTHLTLPTKRIE